MSSFFFMNKAIFFSLFSADYQLGDLYAFDPSSNTWTNLTVLAQATPSAREGAGFSSLGGCLYVHGGFSGMIGSLGMSPFSLALVC